MKNESRLSILILGLLGVSFVVLKLTGHIDWSWWWVTSLFWAPIVVYLIILLVVGLLVVFFFVTYYLGKQGKSSSGLRPSKPRSRRSQMIDEAMERRLKNN